MTDAQVVEQLREEVRQLLTRTPRADRIATIQQVRAFKAMHDKATKAVKGRNVEQIQSLRAELGAFYGV